MLYWHIVQRWNFLQDTNGVHGAGASGVYGAPIVVEEEGRRMSYMEAYSHGGSLLSQIYLHDYMTLAMVRRRSEQRQAQ